MQAAGHVIFAKIQCAVHVVQVHFCAYFNVQYWWLCVVQVAGHVMVMQNQSIEMAFIYVCFIKCLFLDLCHTRAGRWYDKNTMVRSRYSDILTDLCQTRAGRWYDKNTMVRSRYSDILTRENNTNNVLHAWLILPSRVNITIFTSLPSDICII